MRNSIHSIAIVIASQYGQTEKIAQTMRKQFETAEKKVEIVKPLDDRSLPDIDLTIFDVVILGGPVYIGKFPQPLIDWTRAHLSTLNDRTTAFFSVSLNAADNRPQARKDDARLIGEFIHETGLSPRFAASVAGMIHYTKYGFFKRWLLKRICKAAGGPTDTSRDHELTDWAQVSAFVDAILNPDSASLFSLEKPVP